MKALATKVFITLMMVAATATAAVQTEVVDYKDGATDLEGYIAYDDVAFAIDIYGKGVRPTDPVERARLSDFYKSGDRALYRQREMAALDHIKADPRVDPTKVVVIGYCFGGTGALEMARAGAGIVGAVSFHGALTNPNPQDVPKMTMPVMVHHGAVDPLVPVTEVAAFKAEMDLAQVDYAFTAYGNAVHSFTDPAAGNDPSLGFAYNEKADKRSWASLVDFLGEVAPITP